MSKSLLILSLFLPLQCMAFEAVVCEDPMTEVITTFTGNECPEGWYYVY